MVAATAANIWVGSASVVANGDIVESRGGRRMQIIEPLVQESHGLTVMVNAPARRILVRAAYFKQIHTRKHGAH